MAATPRTMQPPPPRGPTGTAGFLVAVGFTLVLANLLISLYSTPTFTLPARLKGPDVIRSASAAADTPPQDCRAREGEGGGGNSNFKGGGGSGGGRRAQAPPAPKPSHLTQETCFAQPDEAETCFYTGPLCFDGEKVVVATEEQRGNDLRTSMCYDFRHFVPSQSCGYNGPHKRDNLAPDLPLETLQDVVPRVVSVPGVHRWGPLGREIAFREVSQHVFKDPEEYNVTIEWLDGPMYLAGMHYSWIDHTWHFAAATMALYDIKRHNITTPEGNNALITAGGWQAPPMDYLVIAGGYRPIEEISELRPWVRNLMKMLIQSHTKVLFNKKFQGAGIGGQTWLCSNSGSVIGLKPRMFNSE